MDRTWVLPQWVAGLPTDRPLVFAAMGTALPEMHKRMGDAGQAAKMPAHAPDPTETLKTITEAAAVLDECTVLVATAGIPVDDSALPPHVHLTERLPQPILLEAVDLFLTHGGFNSVRESLRTATPTAVLPQFGDQFLNARRTQELGLGREITDRPPRASPPCAAKCSPTPPFTRGCAGRGWRCSPFPRSGAPSPIWRSWRADRRPPMSGPDVTASGPREAAGPTLRTSTGTCAAHDALNTAVRRRW